MQVPWPWRAAALASATTALAAVRALAQGATGGGAHPAVDTAVVQSPLPGGINVVARWVFNLPAWVQASAAVLGVVVGLAVAVFAWIRREQLLAWWRTRPRAVKGALLAGAAAAGVASVASGAYGYHYMENDNGFCVSCHVMTPSFDRFRTSEHRKLGCHDCHRQSMFANMRQLYYWVAERPEDIPPHAPVPTRICSECHVQSDADSNWKRIIATAGHRVHMLSDTARRLKVECVTCHGQEVHRFIPADSTCGQTACHQPSKTQIQLGKMAGQTTQHCVGCHAFTAPVAEVSIDSSKKVLSPATNNCLGCHEMRRLMTDFQPRNDAHNGTCGACHNPHTQKTPAAAFETCTTAGCHADAAQDSPFHRGLPGHTLKDCASCHQAHDWKAQGRACLDCHQGILDDRPRARVPEASTGRVSGAHQPADGRRVADGTPAMRPIADVPAAPRAGARSHGDVEAWAGDAWVGHRLRPRAGRGQARRGASPAPLEIPTTARAAVWSATSQPPARSTSRSAAARDTTTGRPTGRATGAARGARYAGPPFSHRIHKQMSCAACHTSERAHGELTVRTSRDCSACHHSAERSVGCEGCHERASLARAVPTRVAMQITAARAANTRQLPFRHPEHRDLACTDCHTARPTMAVTRTCASCHVQHHEAKRDCLACHQGAPATGQARAVTNTVIATHTRAAHAGCTGTGCHVDQAVAALPAARGVCLSCHQTLVDHKPGRECADCHRVQWTPAARAVRSATEAGTSGGRGR